MADALQDVVATFVSLDKQYLELRLACRTNADRDALDEKYVEAEENAEMCTHRELQDDDAEIADLSAKLKVCNAEVDKAVLKMGQMSKVLDDLTKALTIGAQLIAKIP